MSQIRKMLRYLNLEFYGNARMSKKSFQKHHTKFLVADTPEFSGVQAPPGTKKILWLSVKQKAENLFSPKRTYEESHEDPHSSSPSKVITNATSDTQDSKIIPCDPPGLNVETSDKCPLNMLGRPAGIAPCEELATVLDTTQDPKAIVTDPTVRDRRNFSKALAQEPKSSRECPSHISDRPGGLAQRVRLVKVKAKKKYYNTLRCLGLENENNTDGSVDGTITARQSSPSRLLAFVPTEVHPLLAIDELDPIFGTIKSIPGSAWAELAMKHAPMFSERCEILYFNSGANNYVVTIEYDEGTKVCIRVPACGWDDKWTKTDASNMISSIRVMQYLKKHSSIPIPAVIAYDNTMHNIIGAPYMIIECAEGKPIEWVWWDNVHTSITKNFVTPPPGIEEKRQKILTSLASAVAELRHLTFDKMGVISFQDGLGNPDIVQRSVLPFGQCERTGSFFSLISSTVQPAYDSSEKWLRDRLTRWHDKMVEMLDSGELEASNMHEIDGIYDIYNLILSLPPFTTSSETPESFVIAPPDFDEQNIFVDNDGNVTALIDWDSVAILPRYLGWASLPMWLYEDWQVQRDETKQWPAYHTHSPEEYDKYRADYAEYMREACGEESDDWKFTKRSCLFQTFVDSIGDKDDMQEILYKILRIILPHHKIYEHICSVGKDGFPKGMAKWHWDRLKTLFES